jgi:D-alanyl-D-alanine carboxypeptidase
VSLPLGASAAPYAAYVIDARTGEVLHARNAHTRLHPASLTKMMTLYLAFEAVENGEISLDTMVTISRNASSEPPSKLGLRSGQRIAVKSANDAATAIGEALSGTEASFTERMTRTARAMGMSKTTFKNAHGLTAQGHMSTAHDMTILGRHMLYDYPQYYNLFSRETADAGMKTVRHTNRRLLSSYRGADGIKTGYTNAAGFNLVASAERGNERIIATVFGGSSTVTRNAKVAELLDLGFDRAPSNARINKPSLPAYRFNFAVETSLRPHMRPNSGGAPLVLASGSETDYLIASILSLHDNINEELAIAISIHPVARPIKSGIYPVVRPKNSVIGHAVPHPEVIVRPSTSGSREWGVSIGLFASRYKAERALIQVALAETSTLNGSSRKIVRNNQGFDANFLNMNRETADLACRRLMARNFTCFMIES